MAILPGSLASFPGPGLMRGPVCPDCAEAIDSAGGAIGHTARDQAVVNYVGHSLERKALRLRGLLGDDSPPLPPAWAAVPLPRKPNAATLAHPQARIIAWL